MTARFLLVLATFLSGAAALVLEVSWVRLLGQVLGHTTAAVSAVLTAFFLGLGVGSFLFARIAPRLRSPLLVFALLEAGVAAMALSVPFFAGALEEILFEGGWAEGGETWSLAARFLVAVALLFLPTLFMGGTLPVLSQALVRHRSELGDVSGLLYAANTAGALTGALATGLYLIEVQGIRGAGVVAGLLNGGAATLAVLALRGSRGGPPPLFAPTVAPPPRAPGRGWVLFVIGCSGFFALGYEVLWTRILSLFLLNTTWTFVLVLAAILLGAAVGSLLVSRFVDVVKRPAFGLALTQILVGLSAVGSLFLFLALAEREGVALEGPVGRLLAKWIGEGTATSILVGEALAILAFFLIPMMVLGMAFPLAVRLHAAYSGVEEDEGAGFTVGSVLWANTLLGLFGPPVVVFFLLPAFGAARSLLVLGGLQTALGLLVLYRNAELGRWLRLVMTLGVVGCAAPLFVRAPAELRVVGKGEELVAWKEGTTATVAVVKDSSGRLRLKLNNTYSLGGGEGRLIEARQGHIPALLFPGTIREALVIGLGTGNTARALSRHPLTRMTVVEIVPGVIEMAPLFAPPGETPLTQDKVQIVHGDGRDILLRSGITYDLVLGDLFFPWQAGAAELYSLEHFQRVRARLSPRGIFCQWLPLHQLSPEGVGVVVRTFLEVFPDAGLWLDYLNARDPVACLVGGREPLLVDAREVERKLSLPRVQPHLRDTGFFEPDDLLSLWVCGKEGLKKQFESRGGGEITTDDRPVLEFLAARGWPVHLRFGLENLRLVIEMRTPPGPPLLRRLDTEEEDRRRRVYLAAGKILEGQAHEIEGELDPRSGVSPAYENLYRERTLEAYYEALTLAGDYHHALTVLRVKVDQAISTGALDLALNILDEIVARIEPRPEILSRKGIAHFLVGELDAAQASLRKAVDLDPEAVVSRIFLARVILARGRPREAILELGPHAARCEAHPLFHATLGEAYLGIGDTETGRRYLERAIALDPGDARSRALLAGEDPGPLGARNGHGHD